MPQMRKLNEAGMAALKDFLVLVANAASTPFPNGLLTDPSLSEALAISIDVEDKKFNSRMEAAEYLYGLFSQEGASGLDRIPEVWAWLSAFYFEQLCPIRKDGTRRPREEARWIPIGTAFRYYRHLLAGPYLIYKSFRDDPKRAAIVLCGALDTLSDFVGQLAARQEFIQNKAIMDTATTLYLNPKTGQPKRGASPTDHKPGTLRRYVDIVNQLDLTWDLYSMGSKELINRLPAEFESYL